MQVCETIIPVIQGQFRVSNSRTEVLSTVLGSCVAACLFDPVAKVGGMNHFLLPGSDPGAGNNIKYGAHSMEQLINGMLKLGAARHRIEAQLFGAGSIGGNFGHIGENNARFANDFVRAEGFALKKSDLGGGTGRRLKFYPGLGEAICNPFDIHQIEQQVTPAPPPAKDIGDVELF